MAIESSGGDLEVPLLSKSSCNSCGPLSKAMRSNLFSDSALLAVECTPTNSAVGNCAIFMDIQDQKCKPVKTAIETFNRQLNLTEIKAPREEISQLGCTNNVLFVARASELSTMSSMNMFLSILAVMYVGVNIVCLIVNYMNSCEGCEPVTSDAVFHDLEFVATFLFNVCDLFALSYSPTKLSNGYTSPIVLKTIVFINILCSFTSSLLVLLNLERFETSAHELEYCNELTLALFDLVILFSLIRGSKKKESGSLYTSIAAVALAFLIAVTQMFIYNSMGWTADGDAKGEVAAHYFEFAFGIMSASITFWFSMDNKLNADTQLFELMHSAHASH